MLRAAGIPHEAPQERCHQIFDHPEDVLIFSLDGLAEVRAERMRLMTDAEELLLMLGQLQPPALSREAGISFLGRTQASTHVGQGRAASALTAAMSAIAADDSPLEQWQWRMATRGNIWPENAATMGPRAKMRKISAEVDDIYQGDEFAEAGADQSFARIKLLCISRRSESSFYASDPGARCRR